MATLNDLIQDISQASYFSTILGRHDANKVPRKSWLGIFNAGYSLSQIGAEFFSSLRSSVKDIARALFLEHATGIGLTLFARSQYQLERIPAQFARGQFVLTSVSTAPVHSISAGQLTVVTGTGSKARLFTNDAAGTLQPGGNLILSFSAQEPGPEWNIPVGSPLRLTTSLVGVTVSNPSAALLIGAGNAGLAFRASQDGVTIEVVVAGLNTPLSVPNVAAGTGRIVINSATNGAGIATSTANQILTLLITVPSVAALLSYSGLAPDSDGTGVVGAQQRRPLPFGSWLTRQGAPEETDESLKLRCGERWATKGVAGNEDAYDFWARAVPNGYSASPVSKVRVHSNRLNGQIAGGAATVVIAGPAGALPPGDVAAVADNFESPLPHLGIALRKKYPLGTQIAVLSASNLPVVLTGTVNIRRRANISPAEIQAQVVAALANYQAEIGIGEVLYPQKVGARIEDANPSAIRDVALTSPAAPTTTGIDQVPILDLSGLAFVLVD